MKQQKEPGMLTRLNLIGVLSLLAVFVLSGCFGAEEATPTPRPFALATLAQSGLPATYPVARGDVVDELRFAGNVDLAVEEDVLFATGGRLTALTAEHGANVTAGQVVATLDARNQQFDLEDAQLALALAEGRLTHQTKNLAAARLRLGFALTREQLRLDQLKAARNTTDGALALQEIAVRLAEFELAQLDQAVSPDVEIERDRAALRLLRAQTALSDTLAVAPISGQLLLLEGAEVGAQVTAYTPIAVVADPASVLVTASLPPEALATLQEGMSVTLEVGSGSAATRLPATLTRLPAPYGSGRTAVEIAPQDPAAAEALLPGATVQVSAQRGRAANVLWVPPSALQGFRDAYFVRLSDGSEVPVTVGLQNSERVEIRSGLTEGQTVIGR